MDAAHLIDEWTCGECPGMRLYDVEFSDGSRHQIYSKTTAHARALARIYGRKRLGGVAVVDVRWHR